MDNHTYVLEEIPEVRKILNIYLRRALHSSDKTIEADFERLCQRLQQGKTSKDERLWAVYALLKSGYYNYEIVKMLNSSFRTLGRDVKELKGMLPKWRYQSMSLETLITKKYRKLFQPYLDKIRDQRLNLE